MKKFIETLKNCWKVEDLRQRLLITILFTAIYRFGSFVVLPGINPTLLEKLQSQTAGGLMSLLDMFSGGAFSHASIFALGIMPYISASIVLQILAVAVPYFQKMQREGESGRKKINWYTRLLTIGILLFQAPSYLINLKYQASQALASGISWEVFMIPATIILAAGSMFILWLGERITDKGIGNGVSIIIMIGIIARLPQALILEFGNRVSEAIGGGIVRDVLLGYFPPNSLRNVVYVTVVLVVTVIVFLIYNSRYRKHAMGPRSRASYLLADALGLASFTVTGASAGFKLYPELPIFIVLLGTITAVGGGIIRDMLAQRIPSVLKEDVYALPSIIGGIVYYLMVTSSWDSMAVYGAFTVVLVIRLLAIKYNWSLPKVGKTKPVAK